MFNHTVSALLNLRITPNDGRPVKVVRRLRPVVPTTLHWSLTAAHLFGLVAEGIFAVLVVVVFITAAQEEVGNRADGPCCYQQREGQSTLLVVLAVSLVGLLQRSFDLRLGLGRV